MTTSLSSQHEFFMIKKNGSLVAFDIKKLIYSLQRASSHTREFDFSIAHELSQKITSEIFNQTTPIHSQQLQDSVLKTLIEADYLKTAHIYGQNFSKQKDLFKKRTTLKPYEYPELLSYVEAIRHSYWIHTEFNYTADIQDFKVNANKKEREALKKTMLAIAQIEVSVKTFWGDLFKKIPKPEIASVGFTFAESEVRHLDAYSHLLEILGLNEEFATIQQIPSIGERIRYLEASLYSSQKGSYQEHTLSILLFSLFIEHVSLFSQFLIIMSFNKYRDLFKGISNAVEATSKEEHIHGLFGIELINLIKKENPSWFDEEMNQKIHKACHDAFEAECSIIDWIFEEGELDFLPKVIIKEFIKNRLNRSLSQIGLKSFFKIDSSMIELTQWFDDEITTTKHNDFFIKKSINYNKRSQSITSQDLF